MLIGEDWYFYQHSLLRNKNKILPYFNISQIYISFLLLYHWNMLNVLHFLHILGLAIWLGSMVLWAVFAPQLYKIDPTKKTTDALRGYFSSVSWVSYFLALLTGITLYFLNESTTSNWYIEVSVLGLAGIVIALHSYATKLSAAVRGAFNGIMLLLALVVVYLATIYI